MPTLPINWLLKNFIGGAIDRGPVQLTIAFNGSDQFAFKWKAPAGSFVTFNDGDGTVTTTEGQDAVLLTHTTGYSGAGTFNFYITGDVLDLTYIDINAQAFVSGDVALMSALINLTDADYSSTGLTGSIAGFGAILGMVNFFIDSTAIEGSVEGLAVWDPTFCKLGPSNVTGNAAVLNWSNCTILHLQSTNVTFDTTPAWTNASATIFIQDCSLTSQMVDNSIASLSTCTGCTDNVAGTNAHRTAASNDDLNTLLANGNSITLNDTLSAELNTTASACSDPNSNEADSVGDFVQVGLDAGANVFQSQGGTKNVGSYALESDANDTPAANVRFYLDLEAAPISISDDDVVRIEFDKRHIGTGGTWSVRLGASDSGVTIIDLINVGDISFATKIYYFTHSGDTQYLVYRENSGTNNGGIYMDALSIKKVTFV